MRDKLNKETTVTSARLLSRGCYGPHNLAEGKGLKNQWRISHDLISHNKCTEVMGWVLFDCLAIAILNN